MIPKIIHYCWFGGKPLPNSAVKCINSWRLYFPHYEIKEWNESNFDVNIVPYTAQAYSARKFAFVSDFARFWILYMEGGLYFDTDVEVIKDMSGIISDGAFMGFELNPDNVVGKEMRVNPGLGLGVNAGHPFYKAMIDLYSEMSWLSGKEPGHGQLTVVDFTTSMLISRGLRKTNATQTIDGIRIYLEEVFCPISIIDGRLRITKGTYTIHWFDQSWQPVWRKIGRKVILVIGGKNLKEMLKKLFRLK